MIKEIYPTLYHFVRCYLDYNLGRSNQEIEDAIRRQLRVSAYRTALCEELKQIYGTADASWLEIFRFCGQDLVNESEAELFARTEIWEKAFSEEFQTTR